MNTLFKVLLLTTQKTAILQLNKSTNNILFANRRNKNNEKLKRRLINFMSILLFLFLFLHNAACSSVIAEPTEGCVWDYPVSPETGGLIAENVPEHILQCITTENLALLCLRYPQLGWYSMMSDYMIGLDFFVFGKFNGIRELSIRDNNIAINILREVYLLKSQRLLELLPIGIGYYDSNLSDEERLILREISGLTEYTSNLEVLSSYNKLHNNTTRETQKNILKDLWFVYNEKIKYPIYFPKVDVTYYPINSNLFARSHIIVKMEPTLKEIFIENPEFPEEFWYSDGILCNGRTMRPDIVNILDSLTIELIK